MQHLDSRSNRYIARLLFLFWQTGEAGKPSAELKEQLDEVGFTYYLILARLHDLDPKLSKEGEPFCTSANH